MEVPFLMVPYIIMDSKEAVTAKSVHTRLKKLVEDEKITLEVIDLQVADFIVGKRMIERKRGKDFIESTYDGRVWSQAVDLCDAAEKFKMIPCILIEGSIGGIMKWHKQFSPSTFVGVWRSLVEKYKIEVVYSPNAYFTVQWFLSFGTEKTKREAIHAVRKGAKKHWPMDLKARHILEGASGIGGVISDRLLKKYGSLGQIFSLANTPKDMPEECPKDLRLLHAVLNHKYGSESTE